MLIPKTIIFDSYPDLHYYLGSFFDLSFEKELTDKQIARRYGAAFSNDPSQFDDFLDQARDVIQLRPFPLGEVTHTTSLRFVDDEDCRSWLSNMLNITIDAYKEVVRIDKL